MTVMIRELLAQLWRKPSTNPFPAPYAPKSTLGFLQAVGEGKAKLIPPVPTPPGFRGCIEYNAAKCIGCKLCTRVCPANATEFLPDKKKVQFHMDRCCFCGECKDICPVKCIELGSNFLMAYYDRNDPAILIGPPAEKPVEAAPPPAAPAPAPESAVAN